MKLHTVGSTLFFSRTSLSPDNKETVSPHKTDEIVVQDSAVVDTQLTQPARESFWHFNHVLSVEQAQVKSLSELEAFILNKDTLATTRKLLEQLEQAKNLVLSLQHHCSDLHSSERVFLSAYLIATKSKDIFESPTDIDALLLTHANEMLQSFEALCRFMGETYRENHNDVMTEGRAFLEAFHQCQMTYYETFSQWESNNNLKLTKICIAQYCQIELKRFAIVTSPDPRIIDMYEGFGEQQETLRGKIRELLGVEGLKMLENELQQTRTSLEANKWATFPEEVVVHELALDPKFELPTESCLLQPDQDIDAAIAAVIKNPPNFEPMLDVFEEVRDQLASFTPHNEKYVAKLKEEFSRSLMAEKIEFMGLEKGLDSVIYELIEKIKQLEAPGHVPETAAFQSELEKKLRANENTVVLLKQTLDFFYRKFSQIKLEISNIKISQARTLIAHGIVEFEQKTFQARLARKEFNFATVLGLIDSIVNTPTQYRLDTSILCSQYIATYVTHAICIGVLQKPGSFDLQAVPETFYLDRARLLDWHRKYQRIFYTAAAMGIFCQKNGSSLSSEELLEQKKAFMTALQTENIMNPKEASDTIVSTFGVLLMKKGKQLSESEESALTKIMEEICAGNHPISKIINKRLGDQLWKYFFKGYLPEFSGIDAKLYGLQDELSQLGHEIIPLLRLHAKVHEKFYKHSIDERLWKPLFVVLRETAPKELSSLFSSTQKSIYEAHDSIHKMVFLLTGLSLIQQTIAYADMYNLQAVMKHSTMKALAQSFGLIDMIKDPNVTKDELGVRLIELIKHVANEQEVPFEQADEQKMSKMLCLAKNGKSPGYKAFADDLLEVYKQFITKGEMPKLNQNLLTAEFTDVVKQMCEQVKEIIACIIQAHGSDESDPVAQVIPTTLHSGVGANL